MQFPAILQMLRRVLSLLGSISKYSKKFRCFGETDAYFRSPKPFAVQPGAVENPFGPSSGSHAVPSKKEAMSRSWRSGSGSGSSSTSGSHASVTSIDANNQFVVNTFTSSTGRYVGVSMIRAEDAQRYYLPSDCVFVAK